MQREGWFNLQQGSLAPASAPRFDVHSAWPMLRKNLGDVQTLAVVGKHFACLLIVV